MAAARTFRTRARAAYASPMIRWMVWVAIAVAACGKAGQPEPKPAEPAEAPPVGDARVAGWRADLQALARELPARHVAPWFAVPEATWRAAVASLDGRLASLDDAQIEAELFRLVAMIGDGHTALAPAVWPRAAVYPLVLNSFADGVFALAAGGDASWAVGQQLVGVGGRPIDEAIAALRPLVSHDNPSQLTNQLSSTLIDPVLLRGAGLAEATTRVRYRLRAPDGSERDLEVAPGPQVRLVMPPGKPPLALQRRHSHYWNDYVADQRLYYFQYLQCADAADQPFSRFVTGMLGFADQHPVDRFVIDLRFNGGGDSRVIAPLIDGLAARPALAGKVYVVISRRTFSSAVLNAIELKRRLGAILVGEPTGGKPSHHGEVKTFRLPRSGITVQYSTKYFENPDHPGDAVMPDLPVAIRHADWVALRDPVLEAIGAHTR